MFLTITWLMALFKIKSLKLEYQLINRELNKKKPFLLDV